MSSPTPLWRIVAAREVSTTLRSKGFQFSVASLLLSLVALVVISSLLGGRAQTQDVAVVDDVAVTAVEDGSWIAEDLTGNLTLELTRYADVAAAEQAVTDGEVDAALLPVAGGYEVVGDDAVDDPVGQALTTAMSGLVTTRNAAEQGVDLAALAAGTQVQQRLLDPDAEDAGLRQVASFVFVLLFYVTALTFGMIIAGSVTQEKESRVVEILAAAVPIRALLWGKIAGATLLAVGQTLLLATVGVAALLVTANADALGVIGPAIAWYVVFFVIGFVALASLWSVAGSLASRQQDLQATTAPLQLILFAPYIITLTAGEGVKEVVSMLPIVSTMLMPSRLAEGDVPLWQLLVAIVATVLAAVVLVRVGARVYERTLLQTGRKIGFREALSSTRGQRAEPMSTR
ncbi:MAG: ABC transporter permease [Nocardioides sp.]|nr:ABC transporter permease [Nocardioides sp.]